MKNAKNVHHLHGHMPEDAIHFPTGQYTGNWNMLCVH